MDEVCPGIADITDGQIRPLDQRDHERRAHPAQIRIPLRQAIEPLVHVTDSLLQQADLRLWLRGLLDITPELIDRIAGGIVPALCPPIPSASRKRFGSVPTG